MTDTKYEFGRLATGVIVVIDEIHTPDSSRYFQVNDFYENLSGQAAKRPEQLSKEFVREWLVSNNFMNKTGQIMPEIPDSFVTDVSEKYIALYERMLGVPFKAADDTNPIERIESNTLSYLSIL